MKVLVGLGNPGAKYEGNRHNIGFMAIDAIAERHGGGQWRKRFQGLACEVDIDRQRYLLLKPATYMNESGRSVGEAIRFYKISPADLIVFHDEIDLEPGKLRVKFGGGHAGHNGLRSISAHIGNDFQRVRMGVGHPGSREAVAHYVLHDFSRADRDWLAPLLETIAQAAPFLVAGQDSKFMNEVARATRPSRGGGAGQKALPESDKQETAPKTDKQKNGAPQKKDFVPAMAAAGPDQAPQTSLGTKLMAWLRRG